MSHFKIALPQLAGRSGQAPQYWLADAPPNQVQAAKVEMDGVDITHSVRSISIHASATDLTTVDIEFIATSVELEADTDTIKVVST